MLLMGKSTISMAIINCYVSSPEGTQAPCLGFGEVHRGQTLEEVLGQVP